MKVPAFLGGSYVAQSPIALNEQSINFYPEKLEMPGGKSAIQLYPTPGFASFATSIYSPARGSMYQNGRCFFALGAQLAEVSSAGAITARGSIAFTTADPATLAANGDAGDQLLVGSGGRLDLLNLNTNVLSTPAITGTVKQVAYLDGRFLYIDTASNLYQSALFNGSSWTATEVAARSAAPDPWLALYVNKSDKLIWLFGEETSEPWYNNGASPFPFTPVPGGLIPWGIAAAYSPKQVAASVCFLARTSDGQGEVIKLDGLRPTSISTPAQRVAFAMYDRLDDAIGDTYEELGHRFYILTFPSANKTWVFDLNTGLWHERGTWISEDNVYQASRTGFHVFAFGKQLAGDRVTGTIYEQSGDYGTDVDDRAMRRLRRGPSISLENKRLFFHSFEVFLESGLGLASGQGSDPQIMLRVSNNGGKTWGNELWRSAGLRGEYGRRVRWERLGSARDRQYELVMTDPIPWRLIDVFQEVLAGTEVAA